MQRIFIYKLAIALDGLVLMKRISTISLIALLTTPALALTPEQIAQQQLVIQQQQEQALQNERNHRVEI